MRREKKHEICIINFRMCIANIPSANEKQAGCMDVPAKQQL